MIYCQDINEILNEKEVKWVLISSINSLHFKHATLALNADKHVFCEKPLAITIDECVKIRKLA
mgnify:CR=1 FL=1